MEEKQKRTTFINFLPSFISSIETLAKAYFPGVLPAMQSLHLHLMLFWHST